MKRVIESMNKGTISVIVRVYDRMEDLAICVESIRKYWNNYSYYVIIVSNGKNSGFEIPEIIKKSADCVVELEQNSGHLKGNSQLLLAGIEHIPTDCPYTIILEADTWIFSDNVIKKYIQKLDISDSVWASSEWVKKYWSLGLDFSIMKSDFISNNKKIFNFNTTNPEAYVCNYLFDTNHSFMYIKENMPVHVPKSMRCMLNKFGGRFRSFPFSNMITHHIEDLEDGINTKKLLANYCLGKKVFPFGNKARIKTEYLLVVIIYFLAKIFPQSSWIRKKKTVTA
jgi:glycosyltransferase involved in cell wall biosynthesis